MACKNNQKVRLKRIISRLKDLIARRKQEHNATLMLINDLGDDLPPTWKRRFVSEKNRFLYYHTSSNKHFWSSTTPDHGSNSDLDDLHPDDYDVSE